jgi:alpha-galactosidase
MASFSAAHETKDIPEIAANLHRLILPRQSQIWAVLHAADSMQRLVYLLTGGFLGRLCISGEISELNEEQWALVKEAVQFYGQIAPVIARGKSRIYQATNPSWQHLQGAQGVLRVSEDRHSALLILHSFGSPLPTELDIPLGDGWQTASCFPQDEKAPEIVDGHIHYRPTREWEGQSIYLTR